MEAFTPTVDWIQLHEYYYRKEELYALSWDVSLASHTGCGGRFGGPLAVLRDPKKIAPVAGGSAKPAVRVFSQAGRPLSTIAWDAVATIVAVGVADSEKIVIVSSDCQVRSYNVHGEFLGSFGFPEEVRRDGIYEVQIWGNGLCVMTKKMQFCVVSSFDDPNPQMYPRSSLQSAPTAWCVIEAQFTLTGVAEILIATDSGTILVLDGERVMDMKITTGPFTKMAVSPTGKILAAFSQSGQLWVVSTDFMTNLCEFNTRSKVAPQQMVWCGVECVTCYWDSVLLVVGPYGDWIKYNYEADSDMILISEVDGLRIISSKLNEFLQRVPSKTESIFRIGSTHPAAMLYDANVAFCEKSPKADEHIRYIKSENALEAAVAACIEAAVQEWSLVGQTNLLSAASFGKCFLTGHDPQAFVDACQELRILNAMRSADVGMPISHLQYLVLTSSVVVDRLVNRHHHFLAWKICRYLKIRPNRVLIHWASAMVKKGRGDEQELCNAIVQKLHAVPGISYAEIASTAFKSGRPNLATRLLDYEPRAADQIPLLICMKKEDIALQKAIESGDTDLVYLVLLHSWRTLRDEFFHVLSAQPVAMKLMKKYARHQDPQLLRSILQFVHDEEGQGDFAVQKALSASVPEQRARMLTAAADYYGKSKTASFQKDMCLDEVKLIRMQMDLESASRGVEYVGLSVGEFLKALVVHGEDKAADRVIKEFKVPDTRVWWTKLLALVEKRRWDLLRNFADSAKKSPIGWAPFAEACIEAGNMTESRHYIERVPETHVRALLFVRAELFRDAAMAAHELKDPNALMQIRSKAAKSKDDVAFIEKLLQTYQ